MVLGLDVEHPDETLIEFAFDAAKRRATSLRVVHGWYPPPYYAYGTPVNPALHEALSLSASEAVAEVLGPWRKKFPDVEAVEDSRYGSAAALVVDASREASLVVVGRLHPAQLPRRPHRTRHALRPASLHRPRRRRPAQLTEPEEKTHEDSGRTSAR